MALAGTAPNSAVVGAAATGRGGTGAGAAGTAVGGSVGGVVTAIGGAVGGVVTAAEGLTGGAASVALGLAGGGAGTRGPWIVSGPAMFGDERRLPAMKAATIPSATITLTATAQGHRARLDACGSSPVRLREREAP